MNRISLSALSGCVGRYVVLSAMACLAFLLGCCGSSHGGTLVGYWRFEEGAGASVADSSGHGLTGTITGPVWSSSHAPSTAGGSNSLSFDGNSDKVTVPHSEVFDLTNFTFSAWICPRADSGHGMVVEKRDETQNWGGYYMWRLSDGRLFAGYYKPDRNEVQAFSTRTIPTNSWHHIAATYDGDTLRVYVDGQLDGSTVNPTLPGFNTIPFMIGGQYNEAQSFDGLIDEVAVYDYPRSAAEIAADADAGLVGHWRFEEGAGASVADSSGHALTGTITGPVWSSSHAPSTVGGSSSLSFDGNWDKVTVPHSGVFDLTNFTFSAWICPRADSGHGMVVEKRDETQNWGGYYMWRFSDGRLFAGYYKPDHNEVQAFSTRTIPTNSWHHIAATYDGDTLRVYVDGQLDGSTVNPTLPGFNTIPFMIGGQYNEAQSFDGLIDEVKIYDRALAVDAMVDKDEDNLPDWWEIVHFGDMRWGAGDDPDGDAYTNEEESRNGTDPTVFDVGPVMIWTAVEIGWKAAAGTNYQVQWCTDLSSNAWQNFGSAVVGTGGTHTVLDSTRGQARKFYRVTLP